MTTLLGISVLIEDDHADSAELVVRALRKRGIRVEAVEDGVTALNKLKDVTPRVVVLDEMMPGIDGLEVLRQIRTRPELVDVKVVFYSALFDWERHRDAYKMGAERWFVKGINHIDVVTGLVQSLCNLQ